MMLRESVNKIEDVRTRLHEMYLGIRKSGPIELAALRDMLNEVLGVDTFWEALDISELNEQVRRGEA